MNLVLFLRSPNCFSTKEARVYDARRGSGLLVAWSLFFFVPIFVSVPAKEARVRWDWSVEQGGFVGEKMSVEVGQPTSVRTTPGNSRGVNHRRQARQGSIPGGHASVGCCVAYSVLCFLRLQLAMDAWKTTVRPDFDPGLGSHLAPCMCVCVDFSSGLVSCLFGSCIGSSYVVS